MGRKTLLYSESKDRLLDAITKGLTINDACEYAGISEQTYYNWLNKDVSSIKNEEDKKKYLEFLESLKKAQSECQMYCLDFLMKDKSWQSKAWVLERRFPDR
jgi:hypothetical protein